MSKRTDVEVEKDYRRWKDRLTDYEFRNLPFTKQGKEIGVSPTTISKWTKGLTDNQWENIRRMTIEKNADRTIKVNDKLFEACMDKDVAAIKLWKENVEGWIPRQDMGLSRARDRELDAMANEDLVKMLVKDWPQEKRLEILGGADGLPLLGDGGVSGVSVTADKPLKASNEELDRIAREVKEAEQDLKEMTGGDGPSDWDKKPPLGNTIYTRDGDAE